MLGFRKFAAIAAIAAMMSGTAAQASDVVYLGDCTRAQAIKTQSTINKLLPDKRYEGMQRSYYGDPGDLACQINVLSLYTLTLKSSTTQEVVYDVVQNTLEHGLVEGCMEPRKIAGAVTGTVRFNTRMDVKGELCEVYIWSDWKLIKTSVPGWKGDFANRVLTTTDNGFIVPQPLGTTTKYHTPLSFSGVE